MTTQPPESLVKIIERNIQDFFGICKNNKLMACLIFGGLAFFVLYIASPNLLQLIDKFGPTPDEAKISSAQQAEVNRPTLDDLILKATPREPINTALPPSSSVAINNGELLAIKNNEGLSAVAIEFSSGCRATYHWRYKPLAGVESSGTGELYEQYGTTTEKNQLTDLNGKLLITAGPLIAKWSCGSESSGWIYQDGDAKVYSAGNIRLSDFRM